MNSYRDLIAWQKAMLLVEHIYRVTGGFPSEERFGLVSQIRRAAVSVPSNIAEGHTRTTTDYLRFLQIARGSLNELETQSEIARRLNFLTDLEAQRVSLEVTEIGRILNGLIRALKKNRESKNEKT